MSFMDFPFFRVTMDKAKLNNSEYRLSGYDDDQGVFHMNMSNNQCEHDPYEGSCEINDDILSHRSSPWKVALFTVKRLYPTFHKYIYIEKNFHSNKE